jgi:PAS domain S-box-containing protein
LPAISPTYRHDPPVQRDPEGRCRLLLDSLGLGCLAVDRNLQVLYCNPAAAALLGVPAGALLGQCILTAVPGFAESACHRACLLSLETRTAQEGEEAAGERRLHVRTYPAGDQVVAVLEDVTARRQLEEDLVQSAMTGRLVLEQVPAVQWAVDRELRFTLSMGAGLRDLGRRAGEVVGKSLFEFFQTTDPEHLPIARHREALEGQRVSYTFEYAGRWYDCVLEPLREAGAIVGVVGVAHDVTERRQAEEARRRLEQQVYRTQKRESLGLLASGIAHDFNNLLVGILGTAEVLLRELPADAPERALVQMVKKAGENAAELTRQMLVYAGKGPSARRPLDLNGLIGDIQPLLGAAVPKNIELEVRLAPALPTLQADPAQVQQVVMNLVLNAAEAVRKKGSRITLATAVQEVNDGGAERDLPPGRYAVLEVADDGCGMAPEVQARIFDPFFTTKSAGRGLGMSVVQGIVRAHKGAIQLSSAPGEGTTFRVLLPAGTADEASAGPAAQPRRLVLVIDDEPCVRDVTMRALAGNGLAAAAAASGAEAVELLLRHRDEVAVALLNLVMPGLGAAETLAALRQIRPDLRVVLTTGHDVNEAAQLCKEWGLAGVLPKPYTLEALFERVRGALAG